MGCQAAEKRALAEAERADKLSMALTRVVDAVRALGGNGKLEVGGRDRKPA